MQKLGTITNSGFDGFFFVLCDAQEKFGGWDQHSEEMCDDQIQFDLNGNKACVIGGGDAGSLHVFKDSGGVLYLTQPGEGGVPPEAIEATVEETVSIGTIDTPSGELTIALAYPPLNMETTGDFEGVEHQESEIMRLALEGPLTLELQHCKSGIRYRVSKEN